MAVQSSNNSSNIWLDVRGIQRDQRMDVKLKESVMDCARKALRLLAPADQVNLGIALANVPAVDMNIDSEEVLLGLQETNATLNDKIQTDGVILAEFQKEIRTNRKKYDILEAEYHEYKRDNPPVVPTTIQKQE